MATRITCMGGLSHSGHLQVGTVVLHPHRLEHKAAAYRLQQDHAVFGKQKGCTRYA